MFKDDDLINGTVKKLKRIKDVQAILLFGSYARKRQKPISDIDICIITKRHIPTKKKEEISSYASKKIDISLFWDMPPRVRYRALKEGKVLFNRNKRLVHIATVETMSEYLDFKHIIDRNIARVFGHE